MGVSRRERFSRWVAHAYKTASVPRRVQFTLGVVTVAVFLGASPLLMIAPWTAFVTSFLGTISAWQLIFGCVDCKTRRAIEAIERAMGERR